MLLSGPPAAKKRVSLRSRVTLLAASCVAGAVALVSLGAYWTVRENLYTQLDDGTMLIVQADGEIPTGVHERIALRLDSASCHLFDSDGMAIERVQRHPLANLRRLPTRKAS